MITPQRLLPMHKSKPLIEKKERKGKRKGKYRK